MKYEIGDFVSKPVTGICKIENILYLNPQDEKNDKLYYLMKPVEDEKEKIYVPVSSSDSRLRLCLTKEEAWNLIKRIPDIPTAWTNNEKMREQNYKEAVRANNPEALVAIIKMIYQRKQKRLAQGKKCTATDARYFQIAENLLYMELGVALEKPKQEICKTIIDCNGVQREHNKKLNNGLPILHKVPPKRDYGRYFCIMAEKGGTSHGGLTEKLSPFFHAKKQEVNAYGR